MKKLLLMSAMFLLALGQTCPAEAQEGKTYYVRWTRLDGGTGGGLCLTFSETAPGTVRVLTFDDGFAGRWMHRRGNRHRRKWIATFQASGYFGRRLSFSMAGKTTDGGTIIEGDSITDPNKSISVLDPDASEFSFTGEEDNNCGARLRGGAAQEDSPRAP